MPPRLSRAALARLGITPPVATSPRGKSSRPEAAILRQCLAWLKQRGVWAERRNSGVAFADGRPVRAGVPGTADLHLICRGLSFWVEVKSLAGRQTPAQREWQRGVEGAGCKYVIVRSLKQLQEFCFREAIAS